MAADTTIYGWSPQANKNNAVGDAQWYEGMPPSLVNNSARAMMAAIAGYIQDQNYGNTDVTFGANNIQVTLTEPITKLIPGMAVKFSIPPSAGQCPDAPLLKINNLSADAMDGGDGSGLPCVYQSFDPIQATTTIQRATAQMFSPGNLITAIYRPDIKTWTPDAHRLEQPADQHLRGDVHGLLKSDPEWELYASDYGVFMLIDASGAQSASTMLALAWNQMMVGNISWFAGKTPPVGWLIADGSEITDADYPLLAKYLNKEYGGTLTTTILPDVRRNFIRGADLNSADPTSTLYDPDKDANIIGKYQDEEIGSFELKGETEETGDDKTSTISISVLEPGMADGGDHNRGISPDSWANKKSVLTSSGVPKHKHDVDIQYSGYENRPRNLAALPCIFAGVNSIAGSAAIAFKGQKGEDGKPGKPGAPGAPGKDGEIIGVTSAQN